MSPPAVLQDVPPLLLLIGDSEVFCSLVMAMDRARALIPDFEGKLVQDANHKMCGSHT